MKTSSCRNLLILLLLLVDYKCIFHTVLRNLCVISIQCYSLFAEKQKYEKDNSKIMLMTYVLDENEQDESVKSFNRDEL